MLVLLSAAAGWLFVNRHRPVEMAAYVPDSALGYIEINDWTQVADGLTGTRAWGQLAPAYGLPEKFRYLGKVGWLARAAGVGSAEAVMLARAQAAVTITGLEVRGEEVKPRLAVIIETHGRPEALRVVVERRLPELAERFFGRAARETTTYNGVPVTVYRAAAGEQRLLSAQVGGEWILANHPDPLRACVDTRHGRTPSMAYNAALKGARPAVRGRGDIFAFITGPGVSRLLQFGAHLISGGALRATPFAGFVEGLLAEISGRASDGVAYGASFEGGQVIDRYALLFKPEILNQLNAAVEINEGAPRALKLVPAGAREVTVIHVQDPARALAGIEAAVSSQIGAAQSFALHRFLLGAREALFGLKPGDAAAPAIGDELVSYGDGPGPEDRVWLVAARDRGMLARLAENYLAPGGAPLRRSPYAGVEIIEAGDARRGAAAFVGDFLALGARPQLERLIDAAREGATLEATPQFAAASRPREPAAISSFSSVKEETGQMMAALARWLGARGGGEGRPETLDALPLAASATRLGEGGIYIESHAPLGNFPFFVSLFDEAERAGAAGQ